MIRCNTAALKAGLSAAGYCLDPKSDDIYSKVQLSVRSGNLFLSSASKSILFEVRVSAEVESEDFTIYLDHKKLTAMVKKSETQETFSFKKEGENLIFSNKGDFDSFSTLPFEIDKKKRRMFMESSTVKAIDVPKDIFTQSVEFCADFMPPNTEINKSHDFVSFKSGVAYASNGFTYRGYVVSKPLRPLNLSIRKVCALPLVKCLKSFESSTVTVLDSEEDVALSTFLFEGEGYSAKVSITKSASKPADTNLKAIALNGPFLKAPLKEMLTSMERAALSSGESLTSAIGISLTISEDISMDLLATGGKSKSSCPVEWVAEEGFTMTAHTKVVDFQLFKRCVNALSTDGDKRLYLAEADAKAFKIANIRDVGEDKVIEIAMASLSKLGVRT